MQPARGSRWFPEEEVSWSRQCPSTKERIIQADTRHLEVNLLSDLHPTAKAIPYHERSRIKPCIQRGLPVEVLLVGSCGLSRLKLVGNELDAAVQTWAAMCCKVSWFVTAVIMVATAARHVSQSVLTRRPPPVDMSGNFLAPEVSMLLESLPEFNVTPAECKPWPERL